ncbi:redoxin domain-containing protein [Sphingomonas histidinilytica]|uniref:peroxiredoxin-like family protein n=1 Tax=Rhizorhabdus histidinilytica TaxID=439228 RepID=UPI001ADA0839|nr:peroxiredoxin-like family protein [Rhizorhabdus histidinilytica]MBO9377010.1 redoxin domain-containing protein [Rhizorhabdus histidinilytica]
MPQTLTAQFDALHAERLRSWDPDKLRKNIDQRAALVAAFDPARIVAAGDRVAPFSLELSTGEIVTLDRLTSRGPVALVFFRFAGCPACNIALPHYDRTLRPFLDAAGIALVGVSPHLPETGLREIEARHGLGFPVAADRGNALARRFGLAFTPHDDPPVPQDDTHWIGALTGTGSWELPQPAVILIDSDHVVRFVDVSPDWLRRTEAEVVIATVRQLALAA